jgi:hypothetical protein
MTGESGSSALADERVFSLYIYLFLCPLPSALCFFLWLCLWRYKSLA